MILTRSLAFYFLDNQTKKIQDNITRVEKHFGEMCQLFAAYTRKTARLRDKGDLLVQQIAVHADTETPDLKRGMKEFADHLAKIQDYRHAQVKRLEAKVVEPLKTYGAVVIRKREDVKMTQSAIDKEAKQEAQLEKTRLKNPSDRQIIAESELQKATMDAARTTKQLEETIDEFERQKIRDIKKIFSEFVTVELCFLAKALELYTSAYQSIQSVDEEADLEVFRSSLHPPDYNSRMGRTNSRTSLDRTFMSTSGTSKVRQLQRFLSMLLQLYGSEEEEGEEDEEEDTDNEH
uniref:Family with sequence similarity 92 member A1 n=1 Tax=Oryzias latipes TaxID=8090 RepID=A0A3P9MNT9_ORYLA